MLRSIRDVLIFVFGVMFLGATIIYFMQSDKRVVDSITSSEKTLVKNGKTGHFISIFYALGHTPEFVQYIMDPKTDAQVATSERLEVLHKLRALLTEYGSSDSTTPLKFADFEKAMDEVGKFKLNGSVEPHPLVIFVDLLEAFRNEELSKHIALTDENIFTIKSTSKGYEEYLEKFTPSTFMGLWAVSQGYCEAHPDVTIEASVSYMSWILLSDLKSKTLTQRIQARFNDMQQSTVKRCVKCNADVNLMKRVQVFQENSILPIFIVNGDKDLEIPKQLKLEVEHVDPLKPSEYTLYAAGVSHKDKSGVKLGYKTYIKMGEKWMLFDDSDKSSSPKDVSATFEKDTLDSAPFREDVVFLFYRKT